MSSLRFALCLMAGVLATSMAQAGVLRLSNQ